MATAVDEPLLHDQVATVLVDAVCRCGCPSVRLRSEQLPIPGAEVARLSARSSSDYFAVETSGAGPDHQMVSVVLHVVQGLVHELEVFVTMGDEGALLLADITDMTDPVVS